MEAKRTSPKRCMEIGVECWPRVILTRDAGKPDDCRSRTSRTRVGAGAARSGLEDWCGSYAEARQRKPSNSVYWSRAAAWRADAAGFELQRDLGGDARFGGARSGRGIGEDWGGRARRENCPAHERRTGRKRIGRGSDIRRGGRVDASASITQRGRCAATRRESIRDRRRCSGGTHGSADSAEPGGSPGEDRRKQKAAVSRRASKG